ncbi:hypothetical protein PR048_025094 [Dryococelus australis]|uniref:Uncharacterized protein n=1 Tax=Dryococelus australis TaxID=614101 RepID=A0ABQ9GQH9_9NEOP|nr:hypothetical protein PR048_025094 [Dryococelus australis]
MKVESVDQLCDDNWLQDLAFMVAITGHLNDLSLKMQGKDQLVISMYDRIKAFKLKLNLWEGQLNGGNLIHFTTCQYFRKSHRGDPSSFDVQKADSNVQMELIDIQYDTVLKNKFNEVVIAKFYSYLPSQCSEMRQFVATILEMFGSTYI